MSDSPHRTRRSLSTVAFIALLLVPHAVRAGPIGPGFDLFMTLPGTSATLGPLGVVQFRGLPIGPGLTDTIVERKAGTTPGFDTGSAPETIPIEIVALSLVSTAPIEISPGSFFDVFVTLDGPQPTGQMTVSHEFSNGGTFDAWLPVRALLTFVQVGNPGVFFIDSFFDVFVSLDVPWTHDPPPHDLHGPQYPAGGFFPTVPFDEQAQLAMHRVAPAIPLPGTLALLMAGAAALLPNSRRRSTARTCA